jgi:hypothetical protein
LLSLIHVIINFFQIQMCINELMFDANMYLKILFKYFPVQIYGLILETF